jgi:hypothetical protein
MICTHSGESRRTAARMAIIAMALFHHKGTKDTKTGFLTTAYEITYY